MQADNQVRFQDIESVLNGQELNSISKSTSKNNIENLPGSSEPQDLGSISYIKILKRMKLSQQHNL